MLIELLSQSNYQSFNVNLAHMIGLESSIYLNALIEINEKAIRKSKTVEDKYFNVDRDYITQRTTLNESTQMQIEDTLEDMGILDRLEDSVSVNIETITSMLMTQDETLMNDLSKIREKANSKDKKEQKKTAILRAVKARINNQYPNELKEAYSDWLDSVMAKMGFVNNQMLLNAEEVVDNFANYNTDVAIGVIKIATASGWKDMNYAVDRFKALNPAGKMTKVVERKNIDSMKGVKF